MQRAWAGFAKDPAGGLQALGWPEYEPEKETLVRLGNGNETEASFVSPEGYDALCKNYAVG